MASQSNEIKKYIHFFLESSVNKIAIDISNNLQKIWKIAVKAHTKFILARDFSIH
jgi:hypothetical protein